MTKGRSYKKIEMSGVILSPKISKIADDVDAPLDSIPDEQSKDSPTEPRVVRQTLASPSTQLNKSPNQKILQTKRVAPVLLPRESSFTLPLISEDTQDLTTPIANPPNLLCHKTSSL